MKPNSTTKPPQQISLISHVYMLLWTGKVEKVTVVEPAIDSINPRQHFAIT